LPAHQTGNVRLFDAQYRASLGLRESSILDQPVDLQREAGLELFALGVGKAEGGKDVAATLLELESVALLHLSSAFLCSPSAPCEINIRSSSAR